MEHLQFSLAGPLQLIAQRNERSSGELSRFLAKQIWSHQDRQCILTALSQLLLDKECTLLIGRQLRPILLDLLERNAETIKSCGQINHDLHERLCVAMSKLIGDHPDVMPFALKYFKDTSPVFHRLFLESSDTNVVRYGRRRMKLRDLMEAAYKFLQKDQSVFRELWDWSVCFPLLRSHDTLVRWYTASCLALVTCMNDEHRLSFLKKTFNPEELIHFRLKLVEESRMQNIEQALVLANPDQNLWNKGEKLQYTQGELVAADLCAKVVAVCGVLLPRQQFEPRENQENILSHFVLVNSVCAHLQNLAMAVSSQKAVLLEGPVGCGKTSLVEFLAALTGRTKPPHILKVQLGDQTDSKTLLGMYRCTDIPGQFVWQPGTLTQAVSKGHWILLEDIDYAALDVISVLIPLLENGELLIPGRNDCIKVASGFHLFATRRVFSYGGGWYRQQNSHAALLDKYWTKIMLNNLPKAELKEILQISYPKLATVTDCLLDIYIELTGDKHLSENQVVDKENIMEDASCLTVNKKPCLEGRELSLRDLLNWCNRITFNFNSSSSSTALNIFHEALDCFTAMLSKQSNRLKMAEIIGSKLNISKHKVEYYCQFHKPEIVIGEQEVSVGRTQLIKKESHTLLIQRKKQSFAPTRPSLVLIEQLAVCVDKGESVLLVGETGTGKTSAVQYLAQITGHRLRVINMNQQSDTADLLGGYKPVDNKLIWLPLRETFEELFAQTFSRKQNQTFLGHIQTCYRQKHWHNLLRLMQHVYKSAMKKEAKENASGLPLKERWEEFGIRLDHAQQQMKMTENALVFAFVEGTLAQAVKKGEWILLDEINLATAETLECLSGLLEGLSGSLVLLDRGDTEPLVRDPNFRLFACMNPATDVGKRNLPPGIRNRFTEIYIEELQNEDDLYILIMDYLKGLNASKNIVNGIINFYLTVRKESESKLVDGTGRKPHYSLRTLCRALKFASSNPCINIQRSLYEGFCLGFLTQLDRNSYPVVQHLIYQHILFGNTKCLKQSLPEPKGGKMIKVEGYWISAGNKEPTIDETYILTPSVKLNLKDIVRVVSAGTYPVLIQGDTSVGKTSLIRWLAAASGNHCVRINNHEHTDIQEYIGCYTSDTSGKLIFKEGVLIDAMQKGYWIILDELNLAPTDVLEALNRLLDDNRELFITETQETIKAHPRFMLFATQNPPGLYGGRKVLSRAFRNRFAELHFDELPSTELENILHKRCQLPPSYCSKLIKVMLELQSYRRGSSVFAGKHGFITLRDLFRWGERYRLEEQTEKHYDWLQHLANDGFMLLAGRVRKQEEVDIIQRVIEKYFKRKLDLQYLFSEESVKKQLGAGLPGMDQEFSHIVWTQGMRRLAILAGRALEFGEPVLLVGDTGCGKTTICQIFAAIANQKLYSVNCHLHMETSDFLGGLRPVRQHSKDKDEVDSSRLFEWHDGALVLAMREDGFFLMDEISLADDSVLERLNSVLETEKTLVIAEKASEDSEIELLTAGKKFRILATMNPGGDFGKKELSPALRNRFTEIWCPQSNSREDLIQIVKHNLYPGLCLSPKNGEVDIAILMMDFIDWLSNQQFGHNCILSIRNILSWVNFMNVMAQARMLDGPEKRQFFCVSPVLTFVHAACLVYIDGIGSGTMSCSSGSTALAREKCLDYLYRKISQIVRFSDDQTIELRMYDLEREREMIWMENYVGIHPFYIPRGPHYQKNNLLDYALNAGTTSMNAQRLLRALQLNKPILLEGSPGVGKTSLVAALAKASGNYLSRINLSEQTDITDLFGTDLPVEGGKVGEFAWRDGPLLAALKAGHWIVLDELNLASQSVLEGLNACFDHRAEIYVPELGMSFDVQHKMTKIFGCQNPYMQGGGRKGLPKSFLNRFTQVYIDPLSASDMEYIGNTLFPAIDKEIIEKMVEFNNKIDQEITIEKKWGHKGSPWEFNLRDLFRWCQLMLIDQSPETYDPGKHMFLIYGERMRTKRDREMIVSLFKDIFGQNCNPCTGSRQFYITPYDIQVGYSVLSRANYVPPPGRNLSLLHHSLQPLEAIMKCVQMSWMVILVGPAAAGKTSLLQLLAYLTGHELKILPMNSSMDTTELLGGFEQADIIRPWKFLLEKVENVVSTLLRDSLVLMCPEEAEVVLRTWSNFILNFKPKSLGEGNHNITIELVNKLEAVLAQVQRLNTKISSFSKSGFSTLIEEFRHFKLQVIQFMNIQRHGTFEWVDGMLVQALEAGDWLLMDNVNFCSPSVLDRLNALLEPGGVLTLSERGVIDGVTPNVVPHPNFRLFLSMDPSHGEISRAMRNRGVEIYIPGDTHENPLDPHDVKLLLHGLGLLGNGICDTLIAVHTEAKEILTGSTYTLSTLIHTATLIVQRLHRGLGLAKSFYKACWEVYASTQQSSKDKKLVLDLIMKHVSALELDETKDTSLLALGLWPDSACSAVFAAEDSLLSTVHSDGQVLAYCLNRLNLKSDRTLPLNIRDFEKILWSANSDCLKFAAIELNESWADDLEVLSTAVKLFIEKATNQDWTLRVGWLNQIKKNLAEVPDSVYTQLEAGAASLNNFYFSPLSSGISNVIKMLQPNMTDEHVIPMDPRWNMQCLDTINNSIDFDTEIEHTDQLLILLKSLSNRAILFLNRERKSYVERSLINTKKPRTSALRVSVEFYKDPGTHNSLPHAIVAHLAAFFELWDAFVLQWVKSTQIAVSDEKLYEILHSLLWRDRFWTTSEMVVLDSPGLMLLSLHWHWVVKHLISRIPQLLSGYEQQKLSKEIQSVSQQMQTSLDNPANISSSIKKIQKALGKPLPFKKKEILETAVQLRRLSKALHVPELKPAFGDNLWQKEICILKTVTTEWKIKVALLQAQGLVFRASYLKEFCSDEFQTLVNLQQSKLKEGGALHEEKAVESQQLDPALLTQLCNRVQLWPAMEYVAVLWQYKLTCDCMVEVYLKRNSNSDQLSTFSEIRPFIAFCLKLTPATSQQLQGLYYLLDCYKVSADEISLLWSELAVAAFQAFWSSTVTTSPERWLSWQPLSMEEKMISSSLMNSSSQGVGILNRAVFSKCLSEILTSSNKWSQWDTTVLPILLASRVTLGECLEKAEQLRDISKVLWTNAALSSVAEFRLTDSRFQYVVLHKQLLALQDLIPVEMQEEYLRNCNNVFSKDLVALQYICKVLRDVGAQEMMPEQILCLWLTCVQQFCGQEIGLLNLPEAAQRGSLWVNLGLLQIYLWLPQTMFDPAVKRKYKLKYAEEELHQLECEWKTHRLSTQLRTGKDLEEEPVSSQDHPHIRLLCQRIQKLKDQIARLDQKQAFRPQTPLFESLYQEVHQYVGSIAQVSKVQDLMTRLLQLLRADKSQGVQNVLNEEAAWQQSHHQFRRHLAENYAAFPDVVIPLQAAILQMQHGLRLIASEVHKATFDSFVSPAKLESLVVSLLSFPSIGSTFPTYLSRADTLCSVRSLDILRGLKKLSLKYIAEESEKAQKMCVTQEQLLVNALLYLQCHALSKGGVDHKSLMLFRHLFQVIVNEWDEQERQAQEEEEQKKSLYRYKTKSHGSGLSEEEEEEREFRRKFPLHEKDFEDITAQETLEGKMETESVLEEAALPEKTLLSHHSMKTVMMVHQQFCLSFARTLWYQQNIPPNQSKLQLSLFLSCYQTGVSLIAHFYPLIGSEINDNLHGSQLLASTILQNTFFEKGTSELALKNEGAYDFYHHPNIPQMQQCQVLLKNFHKEVKALLQDWPEHPALVQLLVVMDRICSFPLSSPLSKILNGLEILLAKSQDWEENASRALSLRKHLDLITQMIIQWRKLELNGWSASLDNVMKQYTEKSTKHWFSLYQMVEKYQQEQSEKEIEEVNLASMVDTLKLFIEGSTLGEFHTRLQMLLEFHCHVFLMTQKENKNVLGNVLWNLYNYYKQFSESVHAKLIERRHTLEKELKEFVKISRWNDVSFWAVKQSVEKTHRTLFKFMKKFEAVLGEPCQSALVEMPKEEQLISLQEQKTPENVETNIQNLNNILRKHLTVKLDATQALHLEDFKGWTFDPESLQGRLPKLTKRMKKICATLVKDSSVLDLVENLDDFTGDVISSAHKLQNMSVNSTSEKEKQKSEAKHLLMQKQRALAELFKHLATTGLSYRKGLTWSRSKSSQSMLFLHPLDLNRALALVNCMHKLDARLLSQISLSWDGCQKYFYRSLAHHCRLQTALLAPSKEIGVSTVERCKGFTAHLMKMLVKQRKSLTALTEQWVSLRNQLCCIQEIGGMLSPGSEYEVPFPPQEGVQQWTDKLQYLSMQCVVLLEQLSWFIECCPEGQTLNAPRTEIKSEGLELNSSTILKSLPELDPSELQYFTPMSPEQLPAACRMQKQDTIYQQLASKVKEMLVEVKAIKSDVDRIKQVSSETVFHSWKSFEVCSSGVDGLLKVSTQLQDIELLFTPPNSQVNHSGSQMALIRSLIYIQGEINSSVDDFAIWKTQLFSSISHCEDDQTSNDEFVEFFSEQIEDAIHVILSSVQSLVERRKNNKEIFSKDGEESLVDGLQKGHLTEFLDEEMCSDVNSLHIQKIISVISALLSELKTYGEDYTAYECKIFNQACHLLVRLMPLLCKYSNIVLFYLTVSLATHRSTGKLLFVLSNIFTEIAQKGFCLPKEIIEDGGQGGTEFHDYEDGGIGEGEGKKDVSDKIENEDQVEDTYQKGQEKEEEEPDSKPDIEGEDNAIEMSEDFEGKTYDGEQEKDEEDDNSDEDEDLDKQMGNLGEGDADKLDERLWGDEEEEEEEEEEEDENEDGKTETGPGMDEGESELVAKDDNIGVDNQNEKKSPNDEEKEKQADDTETKEKIHEQIDEGEYDENEVDPYHGKQENQPEPEALELDHELNLGNEEIDEEDKEEEGEEGENPFEIEEKAMDVDEKETEDKNTGDMDEDRQDSEQVEKDPSEDKSEQDKSEEDKNEEGTGEEEDSTVEEQKAEEKEQNVSTTDQGLCPQKIDEAGNDTENEEQLPEALERMEHEAYGEAGEENLQSDTAVELVGTASEKDQAKEEHGSGTSDANQPEGHESELMAHLASQKQNRKNTQSYKRKPGQADNERTQGDQSQTVHKRLRTIESRQEAEERPFQPGQYQVEADTFEHIKQGSESYDAQTYDVASEEQQKPILPVNEDNEETVSEDLDMETEDHTAEELKMSEVEKLNPETKMSGISKPGPEQIEADSQVPNCEDAEEREENSLLPEVKPDRNKDSTIHTVHQFLKRIFKNPEELRQELEKQLKAWKTRNPLEGDAEAEEMWQRYRLLTEPLSQQLCEQLRLILEPTQAAKLKGDYRTGKRLNMRKVIPYIASQFRKDKIWLRRTKPSKRQYQICLALDDSASMVDNHSKQLAYESLAVIGNALTLLEVGQIAVCSFGEAAELLHPFHEQFNDRSGAKVLQLCKFEQNKTRIAQLLESSINMFAAAHQLSSNINPETAQLLLIVSDGRGLFLEGKERVKAAVQSVQNANIFIIFVILDPNSRDSILDVKVPVFTQPGELPEIRSYMEDFPFPFYIILRDVNALPETLSDALRQWFELVTASDSL
ncbi:midasin [Erythrolamprus reginae]|uniref:midasin n=1 Tax=Erythrolamprus reginae TaxID=121349 RepID=UPI00396CF4DE